MTKVGTFFFLDFVHLLILKDPQGKEAPNLVEPLDQDILSQWLPQQE